MVAHLQKVLKYVRENQRGNQQWIVQWQGYHSDNAVRHFTFQVKLNTIENRRNKLDSLNVRMYDFSHTALVQHIAQKQPKDRATLKSTKRQTMIYNT
jgi:hypothetical protein